MRAVTTHARFVEYRLGGLGRVLVLGRGGLVQVFRRAGERGGQLGPRVLVALGRIVLAQGRGLLGVFLGLRLDRIPGQSFRLRQLPADPLAQSLHLFHGLADGRGWPSAPAGHTTGSARWALAQLVLFLVARRRSEEEAQNNRQHNPTTPHALHETLPSPD